MPRYSAVRRIQFCAGHRVLEHGSKCRNLHGHNYVAFIHARPVENLDRLGMVIDFAVLKDKVGGWIDANWDHGFIASREDTAARQGLLEFEDRERSNSRGEFEQKRYFMPNNPTAENMAAHLLMVSNQMLPADGIEVFKVELWETENCFATAELPPEGMGLEPSRIV